MNAQNKKKLFYVNHLVATLKIVVSMLLFALCALFRKLFFDVFSLSQVFFFCVCVSVVLLPLLLLPSLSTFRQTVEVLIAKVDGHAQFLVMYFLDLTISYSEYLFFFLFLLFFVVCSSLLRLPCYDMAM